MGQPQQPGRRRPPGVILITIGLLLTAAACCLVAAAALAEVPAGWAPVSWARVSWAAVPLLGETANIAMAGPLPAPVVAAAAILGGTAALVVAIGFFLLAPWGWTGLMLLAAVSLTINLVAVVIGNPDEISMAAAIAAVLYANQRRIQLLFRGEQVVAFDATRTVDVRQPG